MFFALPLVNTPVFQGFVGVLDNDGLAGAAFQSPPLPGAASLGIKLQFAYLQDGTNWDFGVEPGRDRVREIGVGCRAHRRAWS